MFLNILKKYRKLSDEALAAKYRATGEGRYVAMLYERYTELTVSLAMSYLKDKTTAEDAAMDCFERLMIDLKDTEVENFGGWYYSVVRNYLLKIKRRRQKYFNNVQVDNAFDLGSEDQQMEQLLNGGDQQIENLVDDIIQNLKPEQQVCVRLFYLEGLSYRTIAEKENLSEKKVKSHIQNGKRKLKIELDKRNVNSINEI